MKAQFDHIQVSNNVRVCNYGKQMVYAAACHPDNPEVAALGCKLGLVLIVSLQGGGRVLQRMRGHDEDVYGLSWSPSQGVSLGERRHEEWLLASSSRDKTVRVWSEREGRCVHTLKVGDASFFYS